MFYFLYETADLYTVVVSWANNRGARMTGLVFSFQKFEL